MKLIIITTGFIVIDFITGMIKGFKEKNFNSSIMREGLYHKSAELIFIFLAMLGDYTQKYIDIGLNVPITAGVCGYVILMELGSIVENLGKINPRLVPDKIKVFFHKLKEDEKE